jgi:glycine/D-amino acid oxidase-like deaminating enzyme
MRDDTVAVVGAGVVGAATAYARVREGRARIAAGPGRARDGGSELRQRRAHRLGVGRASALRQPRHDISAFDLGRF